MRIAMRLRAGLAFLVFLGGGASLASADTSPACRQIPNLICGDGSVTTRVKGATPFVFEGATVDAFETAIAVIDPTADRTLTIPNADSATATAITCAGGSFVTAFNVSTGVFTCTAGGSAAHNLLSATHSDTTTASVVRGDLVTGQTGPSWKRLALGAANSFLTSDGTDVVWAPSPASTWNELCTASPCTLAGTPGSADKALVYWRGLKLRRVTSCGGIGEYTLATATLTLCDATGIGSGADSVQVTYATA